MPVLAAGAPADHSWLIMAAAWVVLELEVAEPGSEILSRDAPLQAAIFIVDSRAVVGLIRSTMDGIADLADGEVGGVADSADGGVDLDEGLDGVAGAADSAGALVSRSSVSGSV